MSYSLRGTAWCKCFCVVHAFMRECSCPFFCFTMWPICLTDEHRYPTKMHTMCTFTCLSTLLIHLLLLLLCLGCVALPATPLTDESTHSWCGRSRLHARCTPAKLDRHRGRKQAWRQRSACAGTFETTQWGKAKLDRERSRKAGKCMRR